MLSLSPQNLLCPCLWILTWLNTTCMHPAIQTISHNVLFDDMHLQINQVDNFTNLLEIKTNKSHWVIIHFSSTWCVSIEEDVRVNTVEWNTSGLKYNQTSIPDILSTRIGSTAVAFAVAWISVNKIEMAELETDRVGNAITICNLSIPPTPSLSQSSMLHITPAEIRFPYTNDLTENAYILLFPRSSLHNLVSFNVWYFYCMSSSTSLKLHLVTVLWFKWWDSKILHTEVIVLLLCKFLNCPPLQSYPQPLRGMPIHILHTYSPLPYESWTSQQMTWTRKLLDSCH